MPKFWATVPTSGFMVVCVNANSKEEALSLIHDYDWDEVDATDDEPDPENLTIEDISEEEQNG